MDTLRMNVLVTLDHRYCTQLAVMMTSFIEHHSPYDISLFVMHHSLSSDDELWLKTVLHYPNLSFSFIFVDEQSLVTAPTSKRYPHEMYYRLFAADYLPRDLDRILYLDPDIVVINSLADLYFDPFDHHLFKACTHVFSRGQRFNQLRLKTDGNTPYFNSGVLMMNLEKMRSVISKEAIFKYIKTNRSRLLLPDQDVLTALFGNQIQLIDALYYNLSEKYLNQYNQKVAKGQNPITIEWVESHAKIIHYCGRNKPWKPEYRGELNRFYREYESKLKGSMNDLHH